MASWTLGTWFGCGLVPKAPGTAGTLGALPLYFAIRSGGPLAILATAIVVMLLGVWASKAIITETNDKDPQRIVIDEVAGVLIALAAAPQTTFGIIAAVVLFRVFDITKPYPARRAEKLHGGWGVMMDDVVAGIWAIPFLLLLRA